MLAVAEPVVTVPPPAIRRLLLWRMIAQYPGLAEEIETAATKIAAARCPACSAAE